MHVAWRSPRRRPVSPRPFPAQRERDDESSLMHFRARSYDPRLGRFVQKDPIVGSRPIEHYRYASNNPITMLDRLGLQSTGENQQDTKKQAGDPPKTVEYWLIFGPTIVWHKLNDALFDIDNWFGALQMFAGIRGGRGRGGAKPSIEPVAPKGTTPRPAAPEAPRVFGSKGVQTPSKTLWKSEKARVDVENPNPGQRDGQVHYQRGDEKYLWDNKEAIWRTMDGKPLSQSKNRELSGSEDVMKAVEKGVRDFLNEKFSPPAKSKP